MMGSEFEVPSDSPFVAATVAAARTLLGIVCARCSCRWAMKLLMCCASSDIRRLCSAN